MTDCEQETRGQRSESKRPKHQNTNKIEAEGRVTGKHRHLHTAFVGDDREMTFQSKKIRRSTFLGKS